MHVKHALLGSDALEVAKQYYVLEVMESNSLMKAKVSAHHVHLVLNAPQFMISHSSVHKVPSLS